jgi:hypothetical protein
VENVTEQTGSAEGRMLQLETDMAVFMEHPFFGSGTVALRADRTNLGMTELAAIARKADLGYSHWLKHYGILGIAWLVWFYLALWTHARRAEKILTKNYRALSAFGFSYLIFFVVSFVTLNHLMFDNSILTVCLVCAVLVRVVQTIALPAVSDQGRNVQTLTSHGPIDQVPGKGILAWKRHD